MLDELALVPLIYQPSLIEAPRVLAQGFCVRSDLSHDTLERYRIALGNQKQYLNAVVVRHLLQVPLHLLRCLHLSHSHIIQEHPYKLQFIRMFCCGRFSVFCKIRCYNAHMDSIVAKLFGQNAQPSVKRGATLLALLVLLNTGVGVVVILLARSYPVLSGLAMLAWGFGFRHAMDADHIAAIDNVTRRLLYRGKPSVGVGGFFSLGHSTIVFLLTILIIFFAPMAETNIASWKTIGFVLGASVSSLFLILIGVINISVLWKLIGAWRDMKRGIENPYHGHMHIGGPIEKLFRPLVQLTDKSYKMYFIGFLFGLGFDTATEVGLLALSALAAQSVPPLAILLLPLAFMAGMTLLDTINGLSMLGIYTWGVFDAKRRIIYNMNITLLSLLSALLIGFTVGLRLLGEYFGFSGGVFAFAQAANFEYVGYSLAGLFVVSWVIAIIGLRPRGEETR